jgi:hypothetical protein
MAHKNVRVAVEVLRVYKVNALVRLRVNGGHIKTEDGFLDRYLPGACATEIEFLVPRTSIEGLAK